MQSTAPKNRKKGNKDEMSDGLETGLSVGRGKSDSTDDALVWGNKKRKEKKKEFSTEG